MVSPCLPTSPTPPQAQPPSEEFGSEKCTCSVKKEKKEEAEKQVKLAFGEKRKVPMEKSYMFPESQMKKKKIPTFKPKLAESAVIYDLPYESNYRTSFKNFIKIVNLQ